MCTHALDHERRLFLFILLFLSVVVCRSWNEGQLGRVLPSDELKITLMDWDLVGGDDFLGSVRPCLHLLCLSSLCAPTEFSFTFRATCGVACLCMRCEHAAQVRIPLVKAFASPVLDLTVPVQDCQGAGTQLTLSILVSFRGCLLNPDPTSALEAVLARNDPRP